MKSGIDFYFNKEHIYLTAEGKEKTCEEFIPPEKIKYFITEKTSFLTWKKIFLEQDKEAKSKSTSASENCLYAKFKIRQYIKEELQLNFRGYGFWEQNIFSKKYPFGGVPDGLGFNSEGLIESVLGIKFLSPSMKWIQEWPPYFLQLFFYMYLSGVNTAYVCVVKEDKNIEEFGAQFLKLESHLIPVAEAKTYSFEANFAALNQKIKFRYNISNRFKSNNSESSILSFFKITVDMTEYLPLIKNISAWISEHQNKSPKMNEEEYLEIWNYTNGIK